MFGVALSDLLTVGLIQIPVIFLIVDEVSLFYLAADQAVSPFHKPRITQREIFLRMFGFQEVKMFSASPRWNAQGLACLVIFNGRLCVLLKTSFNRGAVRYNSHIQKYPRLSHNLSHNLRIRELEVCGHRFAQGSGSSSFWSSNWHRATSSQVTPHITQKNRPSYTVKPPFSHLGGNDSMF